MAAHSPATTSVKRRRTVLVSAPGGAEAGIAVAARRRLRAPGHQRREGCHADHRHGHGDDGAERTQARAGPRQAHDGTDDDSCGAASKRLAAIVA